MIDFIGFFIVHAKRQDHDITDHSFYEVGDVMAFIRCADVSFHYEDTDQLLFDHLNLELDCTWKSAIIARNGRGKTTLLKIIHGELEPSGGTLIKEVKTELFPVKIQNPQLRVLELIKNYLGPYVECEAVMADFLEGNVSENQYGEALSLYLDFGGYEIEPRIRRECHRLKLNEKILEQSYESLSGGEQTKVQMVMLFLKPNQFILLDEPTNHLDLVGIQVLASYLNQKDGFLVVSHHRDFLNQCVNHVIAIEKHEVVVMQGDYDSYEHDYELKKEYELKQRTKIEKDVKRLELAARERRNWSNAKEKEKIGAGDKGFVSHRAAKLMKRALSVERRINEQLEHKKELIKYRDSLPYLKILQRTKAQTLLQVSHLQVGYNGHILIDDLSLTIEAGNRWAICGPNGCGKTTFIKCLLGEVQFQDGYIKVDNRVVISYVSQFPCYQSGFLRDILQKEQLEEARFRSILGALSCHREIFERDLSTFSLGELKKVDIARSLYHESQLLIWDEPLNGMDVFSRRAIEEAILIYQPTMLFVEHDEEFIHAIATHQLIFQVNKSPITVTL